MSTFCPTSFLIPAQLQASTAASSPKLATRQAVNAPEPQNQKAAGSRHEHLQYHPTGVTANPAAAPQGGQEPQQQPSYVLQGSISGLTPRQQQQFPHQGSEAAAPSATWTLASLTTAAKHAGGDSQHQQQQKQQQQKQQQQQQPQPHQVLQSSASARGCAAVTPSSAPAAASTPAPAAAAADLRDLYQLPYAAVRASWPHPALLQLLALQAEALEGVVDVAGKALTPGGVWQLGVVVVVVVGCVCVCVCRGGGGEEGEKFEVHVGAWSGVGFWRHVCSCWHCRQRPWRGRLM